MRGPRLILMITALTSSVSAEAAPAKDGWLYIHKYLSDAQMQHYGGIAVAPIWFFDASGAAVPSDRPDGIHSPGRLVLVPAGDFHVVGGERNVGLTRAKYTVVPNKVTVVQTGFVQIQTWREGEIPKEDCPLWDGELTAYLKPPEDDGRWMPVLSNPAVEHGTKDFGMLQLLVGKYQVEWHAFATSVVVKAGEIYRLSTGTAGPLGDDRPKGRLSRQRSETADNPSLGLCRDGPSHVLAGDYWLSFAKQIDVYPYEERVWSQFSVDATNDHGYVKKMKGDNLRKKAHKGEGSEPTPAPTTLMKRPIGAPASAGSGQGQQDKVDALFGDGGSGIDWDAPP